MTSNRIHNDEFYMVIADDYAEFYSGCQKVKVGCCIVKNNHIIGLGANRSMPNICSREGCLRVALYGNDDKTHRDPSDCRAVHSEIDALADCASSTESTEGATVYVTRYPCEACARALVSAKVSRVVYGRKQEISFQTQNIFNQAGCSVYHAKDWNKPDKTN